MITKEQQHSHKWLSGDWKRISYNDLKDLPTAPVSTSTLYAHWNITITSWAWTHVITWTWFTPKFIQFFWYSEWVSLWSNALSWSATNWSYHVANNTNKCASDFNEKNHTSWTWSQTSWTSTTWACYMWQRDDNSSWNLLTRWTVTATSTDWFTITKDVSNFWWYLHWIAFW